MKPSLNQNENLPALTAKIEGYLDQVVVAGSDQQLFIASYLQGHFAVAVGQSQILQMTQISELDTIMQDSLTGAFANNELVPSDQEQVMKLWQSLTQL